MRKKKIDPAKLAQKARKDEARMRQMGQATGAPRRKPRARPHPDSGREDGDAD